MRASPSTAARQTMSALEMGDLDADAFGQAPVSLRFRHGPLEDGIGAIEQGERGSWARRPGSRD